MPETVSSYSKHSESPPATITTNHALGRGSAVGRTEEVRLAHMLHEWIVSIFLFLLAYAIL